MAKKISKALVPMIPERKGKLTIDQQTLDSFMNVAAKLGIQAENLSSQGYYALGPFITRNRIELEAAYRSSWLVGQVVDCIAEDMTRDGINIRSELKPDDIQKIQVGFSEFGIWHDISMAIKWGRLYGGAIAVILIDGAKYDTPLNIEAVGKGKFKGLVILDRWMVQPTMGDLITDIGKDLGKPKFYQVLGTSTSFQGEKIHHTRCMRFDGIELPYYQKLFENLWGMSVVERMLDRLMAFDSATQGAAQLLYKAYLRVIKVKGFREALSLGGTKEAAVIKWFQYIRLMQTNEGITTLDAEDDFAVHPYSFGGISDMLIQFGQQISGATGIPLVRLFGQSPTGLNSSGESDLRNYYDHINKLQENQLRPQLDKLLAVMSMSILGHELPEDLEFDFIPLWQLSETEKAEIASTDSDNVAKRHEEGLIKKSTALKELLISSRITGRFTTITEDDIKDAEEEDAAPPALVPGMPGAPAPPAGGGEHKPEEPDSANERLGGSNPENTKEGEGKDPIDKNYKGTDAPPKKKSIKDSVVDFFRDVFKESEHPRGQPGNAGQFGPGGGSKSSSSSKSEGEGESSRPRKESETRGNKKDKVQLVSTKVVGEKHMAANGKPLPPHVASKRIPPGWTNVQYNPDPKGELLIMGYDKKGRPQRLYSAAHWEKTDAEKFSRVDDLNTNYNKVKNENLKNMKGPQSEAATVLGLIMDTGIRPGGEEGSGDFAAYGATTLEGRHIKVNGNNVVLEFVSGKSKGKTKTIPVTDPSVAKTLIERSKNVKKDEQIFSVDEFGLLKYTKSLDGQKYITKDFRTLIGTKTGMTAMKDVEKPTDMKSYKKACMKVAKVVAEKLGNTPKMALKSYINPVIFADWRID
jgi:hypothetical protein